MNAFRLALVIAFASRSVSLTIPEDLQWNYPYHEFRGSSHEPAADRFNSVDGTYRFSYDTGNDRDQSFREETRDSWGNIAGYFGYVDPNGVLRITEYIADHLGYRARTTLRYQVYEY